MNLLSTVWAKSSEEGNYWLPLWMHLRDTYQISGWLWENRIPQAHKDLIQSDHKLDSNEAKSYYQLLAGLHDVGKSLPDFSGRTQVQYSTYPLYDRMRDEGFSYESFCLLRNEGNHFRHEMGSEFYLDRFFYTAKRRTKLAALAPISAHHGSPLSISNTRLDSLEALCNNPADKEWEKAALEAIEFILSASNGSVGLLDTILNRGSSWRCQMILSGYVSMADWIASSEDVFPLWEFNRVELPSWELDSDRLENAIQNLDFPEFFDSSKIVLPATPEASFQRRFGFDSLRPSQKELLNIVLNENTDPHDIFVMEAPMGEGKTEAALIAAEILMKRSESTGLFFGLPTMATGEAVYARVLPYLESLLSDTKQNATHDLLHSKAILSEKRNQTMKKAYKNARSHGLVSNGWLSGKHLKNLNSFTVGTVDNFLMASLKMKFGYWRHLGLFQKVIIIDEVHSMDGTMKHFLENSLFLAGFYRTPVILLSATLKASDKESYLTQYNEGKKVGASICL